MLAQVYAKRGGLIVECGKKQGIIGAGAHFENVDTRFVRIRRGCVERKRLIAAAQVWVEMKVDNRTWLLAAIHPPHSFDAGIGELVEIYLEVDLVEMSFRRFGRRRLRVELLNSTEDTNENTQQEQI